MNNQIPPFYVGQEVEAIADFSDVRRLWRFNYPYKGERHIVLSVRKHFRHNFWLIRIASCEHELCHYSFRALTPEYEAISFSKILEENLACQN